MALPPPDAANGSLIDLLPGKRRAAAIVLQNVQGTIAVRQVWIVSNSPDTDARRECLS
jgi:hypothetical protein